MRDAQRTRAAWTAPLSLGLCVALNGCGFVPGLDGDWPTLFSNRGETANTAKSFDGNTGAALEQAPASRKRSIPTLDVEVDFWAPAEFGRLTGTPGSRRLEWTWFDSAHPNKPETKSIRVPFNVPCHAVPAALFDAKAPTVTFLVSGFDEPRSLGKVVAVNLTKGHGTSFDELAILPNVRPDQFCINGETLFVWDDREPRVHAYRFQRDPLKVHTPALKSIALSEIKFVSEPGNEVADAAAEEAFKRFLRDDPLMFVNLDNPGGGFALSPSIDSLEQDRWYELVWAAGGQGNGSSTLLAEDSRPKIEVFTKSQRSPRVEPLPKAR